MGSAITNITMITFSVSAFVGLLFATFLTLKGFRQRKILLVTAFMFALSVNSMGMGLSLMNPDNFFAQFLSKIGFDIQIPLIIIIVTCFQSTRSLPRWLKPEAIAISVLWGLCLLFDLADLLLGIDVTASLGEYIYIIKNWLFVLGFAASAIIAFILASATNKNEASFLYTMAAANLIYSLFMTLFLTISVIVQFDSLQGIVNIFWIVTVGLESFQFIRETNNTTENTLRNRANN